MPADRGGKALGDLAGTGDRRSREQRDELVPAPSRGDVAAAQGATQQFADQHQHLITREVAEGIVDGLELVDVDHEQGTLAGRCPRRGDRIGRRGDEGTTERQVGQCVDGLVVRQWARVGRWASVRAVRCGTTPGVLILRRSSAGRQRHPRLGETHVGDGMSRNHPPADTRRR
jgi:hypothetical protein